MPFLHIVVLGYGSFLRTSKPCLSSLLPIPKDVEMTIFDNGSLDDSPKLQALFVKEYPQVHSILHAENLGFSGGMNAAVNMLPSPCEWLMLVGNDTVFHPQALDHMLTAMKKANPSIGLIGPMTNSAGTAQGLVSLGDNPSTVFNTWGGLPKLDSPIMSPLYRADFFCVAIRKALWDDLGGLDLSYGRGYYEDFDFSERAKEKGFSCAMLENSVVFHHGSASFKNDQTQSQLIKKNKKIFVKKFPKAELRHQRLDHLRTLQHYLFQPNSFEEKKYLASLASFRIQSMKLGMPKSIFKRWIWRRKIQKTEKRLACLQNHANLITT